MDTALHRPAAVSSSVTWSIYAGLYTFLCALVVTLALADILGLFADVVGIEGAAQLAVLASPTLLVGAATWWALVERRGGYAYRYGAVFGLVTALLNGLLWMAWFLAVWGFEMLSVRPVAILAAFVLGLTTAAGAVAGLPMMYVRRRPMAGPSAAR